MSDHTSSKRYTIIESDFQEYALALGSFVSMFSRVEVTLQWVLWKLANVPSPTAKALFSGVRTDAAISYINRIADAKGWEPARKDRLKPALDQLLAINRLRNDILHYGAEFTEENTWLVSNKHFAHVPDKIRNTHITPKLLSNATTDLFMILVRILAFTYPAKAPPHVEFLTNAWLYKPQQDHQKKENRQAPKAPHRKRITPEIPPKPSHE